MTRPCRTCAVGVLAACLAAVVAGTDLAESAPPPDAPTASAVPEADLEKIASMMPPVQSWTPDAEMIRTYRRILRFGEELEQQYPQAPNLYVVLGHMFAAARELAMAEGDEAGRKRLFDLAHRILASNAPPETRLEPDLLLTQTALVQDPPTDELAAEALERFVARYAETEAAVDSLIRAAMMAEDIGLNRLRNDFGELLHWRYLDRVGVRTFLQKRLGWTLDVRRPFRARLTCLDGKQLVLPWDLLGRTVLIHFWSLEAPRLEGNLAELRKAYEAKRREGFEIVSINLDRSREDVEAFIKAHGMDDWIQTFSGLGPDDPTAVRCGIKDLYRYWIVGPDGIVISDNAHVFRDDDDLAANLWRPGSGAAIRARKATFFASGEFLVTEPVGQADVTRPPELGAASLSTAPVSGADLVPSGVLEPIQACFTAFPARATIRDQEAIRRFETALELGGKAEAEYPTAANLYVVRNRMLVAAESLRILKGDLSLRRRCLAIAKRILDSDAPPEAKAPADMTVTRAALAQADTDAEADALVRTFAARYTDTPVAASALCAAAHLAFSPTVRGELIRTLRTEHLDDPRVRGLLRYFGLKPDVGQPFVAHLTCLDGRTFNLPEDCLGKFVFVYFWRVPPEGKALSVAQRSLAHLIPLYNRFGPKDLEIIGINLTGSRERLETMAREQGWQWPQAFSGKGWDDPTAQRYGLPDPRRDTGWFFPTLLAIGPNGKITAWAGVAREDGFVSAEGARWMLAKRICKRGEAAYDAGKYEEAEKLFSDAFWVSWSESPEYAFWRARARVALKNWEPALEDINLAIKRGHTWSASSTHWADYYDCRADIFEATGRSAEAEQDRQLAETIRERRKGSRPGE